MNVVDRKPKNTADQFNGQVSFNPYEELKNPIWYCLANAETVDETKSQRVASYKSTLRAATAYLSRAISEGFKQNLQGTDINLEIISLYIRFYLIQMIKFVVSSPKRFGFEQYQEKRNGTTDELNVDKNDIQSKFILQ